MLSCQELDKRIDTIEMKLWSARLDPVLVSIRVGKYDDILYTMQQCFPSINETGAKIEILPNRDLATPFLPRELFSCDLA